MPIPRFDGVREDPLTKAWVCNPCWDNDHKHCIRGMCRCLHIALEDEAAEQRRIRAATRKSSAPSKDRKMAHSRRVRGYPD